MGFGFLGGQGAGIVSQLGSQAGEPSVNVNLDGAGGAAEDERHLLVGETDDVGEHDGLRWRRESSRSAGTSVTRSVDVSMESGAGAGGGRGRRSRPALRTWS